MTNFTKYLAAFYCELLLWDQLTSISNFFLLLMLIMFLCHQVNSNYLIVTI